MTQRNRWMARHGHWVVLAVAAVGAASASWLHDMSHRSGLAECGATGSDAICHAQTDTVVDTLDDDTVEIPTDGLPHKGATAEDTAVTMLECSDFECPFSRRAAGTVDELLARNDDLGFYYLHFPLGMFEHGMLKAMAGAAAHRQGEFWPMHDALYDTRVDSVEAAIDLARRVGLDPHRFADDLRDPALHAEIDRQRALCKNAGVRGVPTFFINGKRVVGAHSTEQFQRIIDEQRR